MHVGRIVRTTIVVRTAIENPHCDFMPRMPLHMKALGVEAHETSAKQHDIFDPHVPDRWGGSGGIKMHGLETDCAN